MAKKVKKRKVKRIIKKAKKHVKQKKVKKAKKITAKEVEGRKVNWATLPGEEPTEEEYLDEEYPEEEGFGTEEGAIKAPEADYEKTPVETEDVEEEEPN